MTEVIVVFMLMIIFITENLTLFRMGFSWVALKWGGKPPPPSLKSVAHILQ